MTHESVDLTGAMNIGAVLSRVGDVLRQLVNQHSQSLTDFQGIAVGFAGLVDSRIGRVVSTNKKYDDAPEVDFCAWARDAFGLPLRIENDARLALLGESYAGAARGFGDVVMMTLGTGIGGVAMIEGKLLRGKHAQAGCLGGHIPDLFNGRPLPAEVSGVRKQKPQDGLFPVCSAVFPGFPKAASRALPTSALNIFLRKRSAEIASRKSSAIGASIFGRSMPWH